MNNYIKKQAELLNQPSAREITYSIFQEKHQEDPKKIVGSEWVLMLDEQRHVIK